MSYALARNYQTQALMTASPAELVAMLFDRAIHLLRETERAIEEGRIEARHVANAKAMDVIHHLDMTLDRDQGGEVADQLARLYAFVLRNLAQVDRLNDAQVPRDMIRVLEPIRDSWRTLAAQGTAMPRSAPQTQSPQSLTGSAQTRAGGAAMRPSPAGSERPIPKGLDFSA